MKTLLQSQVPPVTMARALANLPARRACFWTALWLGALTFLAQPAHPAVTEVWVQRYNNVVSNSTDQAVKVVRDAAGDIIVTGTTDDGITGQDMLTIKYSGSDGSVLWQKRYNGPANDNDDAKASAVDSSGNVVVTGYSGNGTNGYNYYTAKYAAADGALLWEKRYAGPGNYTDDRAQAVAVDGSGNVIVTGYSYNGTNGYNDYYTAKYAAANGALLWEKRYNGPANSDDIASAVAVDGSGNVVVTGYSYGTNGYDDYYSVKYATANGALLWEKRYAGPANSYDKANAVAVDGSGNVVVTGGSLGTNSNYDYYTAKYAAADGSLLWEKRYNGPGNSHDWASALAVDGSGNVVVTGYSDAQNYAYGSGFIGGDYYTVKYAAADGALLWEKRYNGPGNYNAVAVAVDDSGNVVVTGYSDIDFFGGDYYTAKYAAADGALLWEKHYNGPSNSDDEARALAVDGNGNVVVTGSSRNENYYYDYYTAKYAAVDGALLWEKRYNGPANSEDSASAVAVDGNGNVLVTGVSYGTNSNTDYYYTAKYAAADGALLWEKRYNGGGRAIAVDRSGNVVVTGSSYNGTNTEYYTAKYAAADGALLWEKRYNGPANRDDSAASLALGPNGIIAITGTSSLDYATVVYRDDVNPISISRFPTGIRLRFTGLPGRSYTLQRALTVIGPWSTIATPAANAAGLLEFHDTPPPIGQAFYRIVLP